MKRVPERSDEQSQDSLTSKNLTQLLELVDEHARDWMRVGQSSSGYVYDPNAAHDKKAALETTASLKQEIERLTHENSHINQHTAQCAADLLRVTTERDRLQAALEWYAHANWMAFANEDDNGRRARDALRLNPAR